MLTKMIIRLLKNQRHMMHMISILLLRDGIIAEYAHDKTQREMDKTTVLIDAGEAS